MQKKIDSKIDLYITKSDIPFIRAGYANFFLLILVGWIIGGLEFINDFNMPIIGTFFLILFTIFILYCYLISLSRISFKNDEICLVASINRKIIKVNEIKRILISTSKINSTITLKIWVKNRTIAFRYYFVIMSETSFGTRDETLRRIEELIRDYGITYNISKSVLSDIRYFFKGKD